MWLMQMYKYVVKYDTFFLATPLSPLKSVFIIYIYSEIKQSSV